VLNGRLSPTTICLSLATVHERRIKASDRQGIGEGKLPMEIASPFSSKASAAAAGDGEVRRAHEKEEGVAEAQRSGEENPWLPAGKE
jgi:hypothetical protein